MAETLASTESARPAGAAAPLSPAGRALHQQAGYTLLPPTVHGDLAAVPEAVRRELGR